MPAGILALALNFDGVPEPDFRAWFDSEHFRNEGVRSCERWTDCADPKQAIVIYEFDHVGTGPPGAPALAFSLRSEQMIRTCRTALRFEGELMAPFAGPVPLEARGLLINAMSVEPEVEPEFNDWYDREHIPALSAVPGALCARRFRSGAGSPRYLAIYHLASPAVQASPEWKRAANTPWTERMRPHFRDHVRIVAEAAG